MAFNPISIVHNYYGKTILQNIAKKKCSIRYNRLGIVEILYSVEPSPHSSVPLGYRVVLSVRTLLGLSQTNMAHFDFHYGFKLSGLTSVFLTVAYGRIYRGFYRSGAKGFRQW